MKAIKVNRLVVVLGLSVLWTQVQAQAPGPAAGSSRNQNAGLDKAREDELAHKHDGYYGALAPQNLAKKRPPAPFNLTGTWFINLRRAFKDFTFGPPYPEFSEAGQRALEEGPAAMKAGKPYRDSIGHCYPAGMPMIMTRVWPINIIQLPTSVHMIFGFTNSYRVIYTDGRKFTDPDVAISTYNGESIGHWEGKALVVRTKYFEPNEHYIDLGLPTSDKFEMVERITLIDGGKTMQIEYTMTDPVNWKGEWHSTKRWIREDYSDVPEVECLPNLNEHLPSTEAGHTAAQEGSAAKPEGSSAPAAH